ncbi:hypothetical protein HanIR_Chr16g0823341 [Helianthus annuus]|nr:hypothetical protein HanIR_Chr16g0823341 [Helianthus annuus]
MIHLYEFVSTRSVYVGGLVTWLFKAETTWYYQETNYMSVAIKKWRIKAGRSKFVLKTTIDIELLEHIRAQGKTKTSLGHFGSPLPKKNDAELQLLQNKLLSISQKDLTIVQYFHKVKILCREI